MKKVNKILSTFKNYKRYQFAIRKTVDGFGVEVLTPMVREPGIFKVWQQIVMIYGKAYVMELPDVKDLTMRDCHFHIDLLKGQLDAEARLTKKPEVSFLLHSMEEE